MQQVSKVLVIIPTYNERDNIGLLVPQIFGMVLGAEVLVVDDNSRDGTHAVFDDLRKRYSAFHTIIRLADRGYGPSIIEGLTWARGRDFSHVIVMDADFSHDPKNLPIMIAKFAQFPVVLGSRYIDGGGIKDWKWHRILLSRFARWYVQVILRVSFSDATSGFAGYAREAVEAILAHPPRSNGYSFLVETKYLLAKRGLAFTEIPIILHDRTRGVSKMSGKVIWESIWTPWRLRFRRRGATMQ